MVAEEGKFRELRERDAFDGCEGLERIEGNSAIKLYISGRPRRFVV